MLYKILKPLVKLILKIFFRYEEVNKPKNIGEQRLVVCANHMSWIDPILLIASFDQRIYFMAKKELFQNKFMAMFYKSIGAFPIDRHGLDREALKKAEEILANEEVLGIFPEGTRIKNVEEVSRENFNNGIAMLATRGDANILPIRIKGNYKPFRKMQVIYTDIVDINKVEGQSRKERYENIVDQVYENIYIKAWKSVKNVAICKFLLYNIKKYD